MYEFVQSVVFVLVLAAAGPAVQVAEETDEIDSDQGDAQALITQAKALLDGGNYESALPLYVEASQIDPRASMAFRGAGYVLIELDRPDEAIPYLKDALRIDPVAHRAWENLGLAYARIYDRVAAELRELAPKAPGGPVTGSQDPIRQRMEVLRSKLAEKDWQAEALIALREAVRLEPSEAKYWYNLGTTLKQYRPSEVNEAADALLRAVELDGTYYPALRNLALFLQRQGRHREARDICLRMEQVSGPDDPAAVSILGDIAFADGDYQEAEQRYKRLLELGAYSLHAHVRLAILYLRQGDLEKSREHTEQAIAIDPENEEMIRFSIERSR